MPSFVIDTGAAVVEGDVVSLYESVGWTAYTRDAALLMRAISRSSFVATAREEDGRLLGLVRAVSDDTTICYVQDLLVRPDVQRTGIGRALVAEVLTRFGTLRQIVLMTDDEARQRAFYQSLGFVEGADLPGGPLRAFLRIG
ncbi:MAG TPA: GNAT family N-acetyltransferase [Lacisediminihabitans sp.]|uniref:GNAT family N-acetyltransferase n=1 Tax=Lacisediminihabitans sp. TaxID=2787631 RepID=UPI002EDA50D3